MQDLNEKKKKFNTDEHIHNQTSKSNENGI